MTSIKNYKPATVLLAIAAIAGVLVVSTIAIGNGRIALAQETVTKNLNNAGVNIQTSTNQKRGCETAGGTSPIGSGGFFRGGTCSGFSADNVTQSGGILHK